MDVDDANEDTRVAKEPFSFSKSSTFTMSFSGEICKVFLPYEDNLYCRYTYVYGTDWLTVAGVDDGLTQIANRCESKGEGHFAVWNHPIDITFASSNAFGWPQLVLSVYGLDTFGHDVIKGYGAVHLPPVSGCHQLTVPLYAPESSSLLARIVSWFTGNKAEFVHPKVAAQAEGRGVLKVQSCGMVTVNINVLAFNLARQMYKTH